MNASFELGLHSKDIAILYRLKEFFGVGSVSIRQTRDAASFKVSSISDLKNVIIPHFKKYSLLTQKKVDFDLWVKIVNLIYSKKHLTPEGLAKILELKSVLNRGLSTKIKLDNTNVKLLERPLHLVSSFKCIKPMWLVGFTDGEGSFNLRFIKRATGRNQIDVRFRLTQHIRDLNLLTLITEYLGCGKIYMMSLANSLEVFSYSVIRTKIAPFFTKYPLETEKAKDFIYFSQGVEIVEIVQIVEIVEIVKIEII